MTEESTQGGGPGRPSKVARLIDEYDLDGVGATLEARWTADGEERASLRDLADQFNRTVLEAALRQTDSQPLEGEVDNVFRLLTSDDVSAGERTRVKRRLERDGLDVDSLQRDFVSYQAIRTYLQNEREATYEEPERDRIKSTKSTVDQLRGRTATVTESRLDDLTNAGDLRITSPTVVVDVRVRCDECGSQYALSELLDRGECECGE